MAEEMYKFRIEAEDEVVAQRGTRSLADDLRELPGVVSVERQKEHPGTMDLGVIVSVLATSGATLAIARGVADWIRRTRGTRLVIEKGSRSGSIKLEVYNIDPAASERIVEIISAG
jgi:hypothetical protein